MKLLPKSLTPYQREKMRLGPARFKAKTRRARLRARFGITPAIYTKMLTKQKGVCAICLRPPGPRRLAVDHDHQTGKIRGLLCYRCNYFIIGNHRDPILLENAARYLRQWAE